MFQDGDVIAFDYDLFVDGQEGVYDTTQRSTAESHGILDADAHYLPMSYILGAGRLIAGLEEALRQCEIGKRTTIELEPEKAYGARDPKLIETIPMQEFKRNKVDPTPGLQITYKNRRGLVTNVGGGRVRVDFNHSLAGKRLKYVLTVRSVADSVEKKVRGIIQMVFPTKLEWNVQVRNGVATLRVPDALRLDQNFLVARYRIVAELRQVPELSTVEVVEAFPMKGAGEGGGAAPPSQAAKPVPSAREADQ